MDSKEKVLIFVVGIVIIFLALVLLALNGGDLSDVQFHRGFRIHLN